MGATPKRRGTPVSDERRSVHQTPGFRRAIALLSNVPTIGIGLPVSAVLAPLLIPLRRDRGELPWLRTIGAWGVVSVLALIVSSLLHQTPVLTGAAGQITVFLVMILALPVILTSLQASAQFLCWFAVGAVAYFLTIGIEEGRGSFEGLWKYGIAFPVTVAVVYAMSLRGRSRGFPAAALFLVGTLGIFLNFRSHGLICFAAALLLLAQGQRRGSAIRTVILGGVALVTLLVAMPRMIASGVFGEAVRLRTELQSSDGPLLLGGRTEPPLSIAAIFERPIAGWGSAQTLPADVISRGSEIARALGLESPASYLGYWVRPDGFISLHSVFFSSWVEGGILAAVFPAILIVFFIRAALTVRGPFAPVITLVAIQSVWDLLFSPWTNNKGVAVAAAVIACAYALRDSRSERLSARRDSPEERPARAASTPRRSTGASISSRRR